MSFHSICEKNEYHLEILHITMRFMHSDNWDDMRFVLAVADTGTVSGAARQLGVNHATVLRRIAAFEVRHDIVIFDRTSKGYMVKPECLRMIDAAREVGDAVRSMENLLRGTQAPLVGTVRVSSTDTFCHTVLPSIIREFHNSVSGIKIALISTNAHSDLSRSHAEIAVRPTLQLSEDLTGEIGGYLGFGVYAAPGGLDNWLGQTGPLTRSVAADWLAEHVAQGQIVGAADSFVALSGLVRQGLGRSVLPCCLADPDPMLIRLDNGNELPSVPIWVACHSEMVRVSRIAAARKYVLRGLEANSDLLLGQSVS